MAEHVTKAEAHESANHHWRIALRHRGTRRFWGPVRQNRICKAFEDQISSQSTLHLDLESRGLRVLQKRFLGFVQHPSWTTIIAGQANKHSSSFVLSTPTPTILKLILGVLIHSSSIGRLGRLILGIHMYSN